MNHRPKEALDLFERMTTTPNAFTLSIFFKMCTDLADDRSLELAKKVFQSLSNIDRNNPLVANAASTIFMNKGKHAYGEMMFGKRGEEIFSVVMRMFCRLFEKSSPSASNRSVPDH